MNRQIFTATALVLIAAFAIPGPAFATEGGTQIDLSQPGHPCYLLTQAPFGQAIDWTAFSTDWKLSSGNALDISLGPANNGTAVAVCQGAQARAAPTYATKFSITYKGTTNAYTLVHVGESTSSLSAYLTASNAKPAEYAALGLTAPKPAETVSPEPTGTKEPAQALTTAPAAQTTPPSPALPITLALGSLAALIAASAVGIRRLVKKRGAANEN